MKIALLKEAKKVELVDIDVPEIGSDEALVEVKFCGICGTDVASYKNPEFFPPGTYLGHEFSGVISKLGSDVQGYKVGDRVTATPMWQCGKCDPCRHGLYNLCVSMMDGIGCAVGLEFAGAFAKYVRIPQAEKRLYKLPDNVSFEAGALIEPLATSLHATRLSSFKAGNNVMVFGMGGIGLGVVMFMKQAGAGLIIAVEVNKSRAAVAKKLGADYVINPMEVADVKEEAMKLTDGKGINNSFLCTGAPPAFTGALNVLGYRGQLTMIGLITQEIPFTPVGLNMGELNIQGSLIYTDEFDRVIDMLKKKAIPAEDMVSAKIKLSELSGMLDKLIAPTCTDNKVLVYPD